MPGGIGPLDEGVAQMNTATFKQIGFLKFLAGKAGFDGVTAAWQAWSGEIKGASALTIREASELIDELKSGRLVAQAEG